MPELNLWLIGALVIIVIGGFFYFYKPFEENFFSKNGISLNDCQIRGNSDYDVCCLRSGKINYCNPNAGEFVFVRVDVPKAVEMHNSQYNDSVMLSSPYIFCVQSELNSRQIKAPEEYDKLFFLNNYDSAAKVHVRCTYPRTVAETRDLVAFGFLPQANATRLIDIDVEEGNKFNSQTTYNAKITPISLDRRIFILWKMFR